MFPDGKIDNIDQNHKNPESEDTKIRVVLEVQHLDRERKKSPLMLDSDGILLRLQHEEYKQPTCFGAMETKLQWTVKPTIMQLMECCGTLDKKKSQTLLKKICDKRPRFEDDGGHDDKKESLCSASVRKQKNSVTFDPSGLLKMLSMNGTER